VGALTRLNVIQNNALRAIFKMKREFGNEPLRMLAKEFKLVDPMRDLKKRYLSKCIDSSNPILTSLIEEYKTFANGRILNTKTPLCDVLNQLDHLTSPLSSPIRIQSNLQSQPEINEPNTNINGRNFNVIVAGSRVKETDFYSRFNLGH
jgi:hypothetical protein